jgi:hypothetical protein
MNLLSLVPSIAWLRQYRREWLRPDMIGGLTAAAVVIPKAMAVVQRSSLGPRLGRERMFFNVETAVEAFRRLGAPGAAIPTIQRGGK